MSHPLPPAIPARRQRGAALLLLLLLLGLGVSTLLMSSPTSDESMRQRQTAQRLVEAREALLGYAMTHGRLPRPAISAEDGREMGAPCDQQSCTGFLPWVTLGVTGSDSWGKLLRYSVTPSFAGQRVVPDKAVADKRVISRKSDGEPFYVIGADTCSFESRCTPAVVLSSGKYNLGTSAQGVPLANGTINNVDEQQNNSDTGTFVYRRQENRPDAPGGEFDDLVVWIPLQAFYRRLEISGMQESNKLQQNSARPEASRL